MFSEEEIGDWARLHPSCQFDQGSFVAGKGFLRGTSGFFQYDIPRSKEIILVSWDVPFWCGTNNLAVFIGPPEEMNLSPWRDPDQKLQIFNMAKGELYKKFYGKFGSNTCVCVTR